MKTDENVEKARTLVRADHCLGIRMIAEELNLDKEMRTNFNNKFEHGGNIYQNCPNCQFLAGKQISTHRHAPNSPDHALCDVSFYQN